MITIYTKGCQFDDVKGAYCRIYDPISQAEFLRYNLSENIDNISNGNIIATIKKNQNSWSFKARGYYTKNTEKSSDI